MILIGLQIPSAPTWNLNGLVLPARGLPLPGCRAVQPRRQLTIKQLSEIRTLIEIKMNPIG